MSKWLVRVRRVVEYQVEVEALSWAEAREAGAELPPNSEASNSVVAEPIRQIGEPWLRCISWYDLHEVGDVVLAERSYGNHYTEDDIALLCERLESLGLKVRAHWNGVGCTSVSFRCSGRNGEDDFSAAERAVLEAPRPGVVDE